MVIDEPAAEQDVIERQRQASSYEFVYLTISDSYYIEAIRLSIVPAIISSAR